MILEGRFQILKGYQKNHVTIGFGSYGQVKLAKDLERNQIVAVKVINKIAKNQIMMHYRLSHSKIIKLIDVHIDTERQITYMILQYAEGGTLFDKIKMQTISKTQIKKYFRDICEAVAYLHSQNIMHRDIKPQNILLTRNDQAKLCDFGFAAILGERKTLCGTYQYMSPQMIQKKAYDYKIDIWAVGILLFELISGHAPFRGDKPDQVLQQMKTKIYFCDRFEVQDINLVKTILRVTPNKRPTIQQILEQPFFKVDDKYQQLTTKSTTNTEEFKTISPSLQYLNQSCNPNKIIQLNKTLHKEQIKQSHKQTYPPFYVPKHIQKIQVGMPTSNIDILKEMKSFSPLHKNLNIVSNIPTNTNTNQFGFYRPLNQMNPFNSVNKSLTNMQKKSVIPQIKNHHVQDQMQMPLSNMPISYVNPNKTNPGFGRFS